MSTVGWNRTLRRNEERFPEPWLLHKVPVGHRASNTPGHVWKMQILQRLLRTQLKGAKRDLKIPYFHICTSKILVTETYNVLLWKVCFPVYSLLFIINAVKPYKSNNRKGKGIIISSTDIPLSHSNLKQAEGSSHKHLTAQIRKKSYTTVMTKRVRTVKDLFSIKNPSRFASILTFQM